MRVLAELVGPAVPVVVDGADEVWARADQSCERTTNHSWKFALSGALSFNTYFGSFPLWKWREETTLKNLSLLVSGKGQFDIQIDYLCLLSLEQSSFHLNPFHHINFQEVC